jgi:disulfide bond formation protein DsbB
MFKIKGKKGMGIGDIYPAVLAIGLSGLIIGIVIYVLAKFQTNIGIRICTDPANYAWNATAGVCHNLTDVANTSVAGWNQGYMSINQTITGIATFPAWIPILVTVIALSIVLTVVISSFSGQGRR